MGLIPYQLKIHYIKLKAFNYIKVTLMCLIIDCNWTRTQNRLVRKRTVWLNG